MWRPRPAATPAAYGQAVCCRAAMLPLLTRDVTDAGLICQHCNDTRVAFDEIPAELQNVLRDWSAQYAPVHGVAHWDDRQRKAAGDYERALDQAASEAEALLARAGRELAPKLLEIYTAVVWEDQDEWLEVRPEDVGL